MMKRYIVYVLILFSFLFASLYIYNFVEAASTRFIESLTEKVAEAEREKTTVVIGEGGWLFFAPELRHLSAGQFWDDAAKKVSKASKPEYADPLPAILDFKEQLENAGIALIFVPIPAKATIYPEKISDHGKVVGRTDEHHQTFYEMLRQQGVNVLDLTDLFLEHRFSDAGELYCRQDTHWSGQACILAAEAIVKEIGNRAWMEGIPKRKTILETQTVEITGDLWKELGDKKIMKEKLQLSFVKEVNGSPSDDQSFGRSWRASPVVLLGDSHNLVFHAGGDMHGQGSGLPDHLAHQLGFAVDVVAVRGSGATPSRLNLFRRRDNMRGKRVVVWCLSVREFTEGQGWRKVPVIR